MCELQAFAKNVWLADGPSIRAMGMPFPTRMIVVKLSDGSLWVNSPVRVPHDKLDRITAFGPVRYLIAPTVMHVWRLAEWHTLFPAAELWAPPQIPIEFKRLPFAGILGVDRRRARRTTSTNSSSKATFSSTKFFSFIKNRALSS